MSEYAAYEPESPGTEGLPPVGPESIRRARHADAAGIAALVAARHGTPFERALDGARREFAGIATGNPWVLFVADVDGGVVGFGRARQTAAQDNLPAGWYLMGLIVHTAYRRRGIGLALTRRRLAWIQERSNEAYYFVNKKNRASIDLHSQLGFEEITDDFQHDNAHLARGEGYLYRISLA